MLWCSQVSLKGYDLLLLIDVSREVYWWIASCDGARHSSQHYGQWPVVLSLDESECDRMRERDPLGLIPNLTTRDLWRSMR
jgi:hypothetical protein